MSSHAPSSRPQDEQQPHASADLLMHDVPVPTEENGPLPPPALGSGGSEMLIRRLPGGTDTAESFEIQGEDHTLGNSLRYVIMKNPDVEFCGYSIPHPSEPKMNIRIQTYDGTPTEALEKGLVDLEDLCDVVMAKFGEAVADFIKR